MYETDELIDEIRRLEKQAGTVYIVTLSGSNEDGDAWTIIGPVYSYLPDYDQLVEDLKQELPEWGDYDYFIDSWYDNHAPRWGDCTLEDHRSGNDCEDEDCDKCCDAWKGEEAVRCKQPTRQEYADEYLNLGLSSYARAGYERSQDALVVNPDANVYIYLGSFSDSYYESHGEVHIRNKKVRTS